MAINSQPPHHPHHPHHHHHQLRAARNLVLVLVVVVHSSFADGKIPMSEKSGREKISAAKISRRRWVWNYRHCQRQKSSSSRFSVSLSVFIIIMMWKVKELTKCCCVSAWQTNNIYIMYIVYVLALYICFGTETKWVGNISQGSVILDRLRTLAYLNMACIVDSPCWLCRSFFLLPPKLQRRGLVF